MITYCHLVTTLLIFLLAEGSEIEVTNSNPTVGVFHYETHRQLPFNGADGHGDNWCRPFNGFKLLYSPDLGEQWDLHDGRRLEPGERSGLSHPMEPKDNLFWREDPSPITGGRIMYTGLHFSIFLRHSRQP